MPTINDHAIAARIRGILGGIDHDQIEAVALDLGVGESELRAALHPNEPHPTVEVIAAIVRHYGVDPSWLISGEYDATTHRAALGTEAERTKSEIVGLVAQQLTSRDGTPRSSPTLELGA